MSEQKVKLYREDNEKSSVKNKKGRKNTAGRVLAVVGVTLAAVLLTAYLALALICKGPSDSAKQLFVTTMLETGAFKFIPSLFLSDAEIQKFVDGNSMAPVDDDVDINLIKIPDKKKIDSQGTISSDTTKNNSESENGIEIYTVSGRTFQGTVMIVNDPSRVVLNTVYDEQKGWPEYGKNLDVLVNEIGGIAGVNGGIYEQNGVNKGGSPSGIVVCNGKIQMNKPKQYKGLYLIGFNYDNILIIKSIADMDSKAFEAYVKEAGIRDACVFQEESSDKNNHFVQLVINGEPRELNGAGSGLNPRTAIGQRADGAIIFLATDGRGANSHLGASASDIISIMMEYGAVNAANLDGGSSTCMYYNGEWLKTSVTFKYSHASWYLPLAFVVK